MSDAGARYATNPEVSAQLSAPTQLDLAHSGAARATAGDRRQGRSSPRRLEAKATGHAQRVRAVGARASLPGKWAHRTCACRRVPPGRRNCASRISAGSFSLCKGGI
jgi:hypothetical protein